MRVMGEIVRKFFWFVVVCVVVYFAYMAYVRWWNTDTFAEKKYAAEQYVTQKTGEVVKKIEQTSQEYTSQVVGEVKQTALQAIKEKISAALGGIEKKMMDSAESIIGASSTSPAGPVTISSLTGGSNNTLPTPTSSDFLAPAPPATFITQIDVPIVFSINRNTSYVIDWGDTFKDSGTVQNEVVKLVSHSWKKEGDYVVTIIIKGVGVNKDYVFPIRVFK
jgi:hypothetical protein